MQRDMSNTLSEHCQTWFTCLRAGPDPLGQEDPLLAVDHHRQDPGYQALARGQANHLRRAAHRNLRVRSR